MILLIAIVVITQSFGTQGVIDIVQEDVICTVYSEEYFTEPDAFVDEQNGMFVNFTMIKQLPIEAQGHLVILGASMGEYIVNTGLDFQLPLCDLLEEPIILGPLFKVFGFSTDNCPPGVGVYGSEGYVIRTDTLPDDFPANKYVAEFNILYEEKSLMAWEIYISVH